MIAIDCKERFSRTWRFVAVVAAGASFLLTGCSGDGGPDRVPLRGTVQLGGRPVAAGSISLMPDRGHTGPSATTSIAAGLFAFTEENGPTSGPHRAIVRLSPPDKAKMLSGTADPPAKTRWEVHVEVPDREPLECDLKLD